MLNNTLLTYLRFSLPFSSIVMIKKKTNKVGGGEYWLRAGDAIQHLFGRTFGRLSKCLYLKDVKDSWINNKKSEDLLYI